MGGEPSHRDGRAGIQAILLPGLFPFAPGPRGQASCLMVAVSAPATPVTCFAISYLLPCDWCSDSEIWEWEGDLKIKFTATLGPSTCFLALGSRPWLEAGGW